MNQSAPSSPARREMLAAGVALAASGITGVAHAQALPLPRRPEDVQPYFAKTFNAGDLDAVMKVYVSDAVFVPKPGTVAKGHDAIRAATADFMGLKLPIAMTQKQVLVSGDIALLVSDWIIDGKGPDGNLLKLTGTTADVARRQADGTWLVLIDNPFGTA